VAALIASDLWRQSFLARASRRPIGTGTLAQYSANIKQLEACHAKAQALADQNRSNRRREY